MQSFEQRPVTLPGARAIFMRPLDQVIGSDSHRVELGFCSLVGSRSGRRWLAVPIDVVGGADGRIDEFADPLGASHASLAPLDGP